MTGGRRGTSEVVGFLLVFSIVFAGIGVVQTAGFDTVSELRDRERVESAELAFATLSGHLDDVRSGGVPRATTLALGSGRLAIEDGPTLMVRVNGTVRTVETTTLAYRLGRTRLTYASGGVIRADGGESVVRREPAMACRRETSTAVVSVVTFHPSDATIDTDGPVEIVARPRSTSAWVADQVSVNVSPGADDGAWGRYLEATGWNDTDAPSYSCDADHTVVRRVAVAVRFVA